MPAMEYVTCPLCHLLAMSLVRYVTCLLCHVPRLRVPLSPFLLSSMCVTREPASSCRTCQHHLHWLMEGWAHMTQGVQAALFWGFQLVPRAGLSGDPRSCHICCHGRKEGREKGEERGGEGRGEKLPSLS